MKITLSRASAAAGAAAALLPRLFYGLMVDGGGPLNGAWLSAIAGLMLALPALWLMRRRPATVAPVLLALLILDAASALECLGFSASFLAFSHVPIWVLMLPPALAALWCVHLGGDVVGASARLWLWALSALLLVVVVGQRACYRPAWVCPLLGHGPKALLRSALKCAGWITLLSGSAMQVCREAPRMGRVAGWTALAVAGAAVLMLLRLMMAPPGAILETSRTVRLDALLVNGRAPLYLQGPMIVIWFMAMLHLLCYECTVCAALLGKWLKGAAGILVTAGVLLLAMTRAFRLPWLPELMGPALLLLSVIGRGRDHA